MKKEKVFIVLTHKSMTTKGSHPGRNDKQNVQWEIAETVEFVNQVRKRHLSTATVIADYINRKMIVGERHGMGVYEVFDEYVRKKYPKQMAELDAAYAEDQVKDESPEVIVDQFGTVREKTVFDV